MVDERIRVSGVEITHFVPAGTSPLRHHIYFAAVFTHAVTKVKSDRGPIFYACKRRNRIAVCIVRIKSGWFEISKLWQQHRQ